MKCQTCEQDFQDTAVKVWNGMKVCPSCFVTLTRDTLPENRTVTHHIQEVRYQTPTTVCPKCNAEIHVDTRTCPKCGVSVRQSDRLVEATGTLAKATAITAGWVIRVIAYSAIAVLCLVLLLAVIGSFARNRDPSASTEKHMQSLANSLRQYKAAHGTFPSTDEGLRVLSPRSNSVDTLDSWGHEYTYSFADGVFTLVSNGPNGFYENGRGDDIVVFDR